MTRNDRRQEIGELTDLVNSQGWARFKAEAESRRFEEVNRLLALKDSEVTVRDLLRRKNRYAENLALVEWPEERLKSLLAAEARA